MTKSNKKSIPVKALSTAVLLGTISAVGVSQQADAATGEKPTIEAPDQQVKYGTTWDPYQNVTAHDKEDGDLSEEVYYEAPYFKTTNPGNYNVRYGVYDLDDNLTEINRNVQVLKDGVEPGGSKPKPSQPEQPKPDKPETPNTPEQPDNNKPSNEPTDNKEQPNNTTPDKPNENNPSDTNQPNKPTPEQPSDNNSNDVNQPQPNNTNPSDTSTDKKQANETPTENPSENIEKPNNTTIQNQPTKSNTTNTTSEQPTVEKVSNDNTQRTTKNHKTTTTNDTSNSTQDKPTSKDVTSNNTSDDISPEKVETKHDLDHSGIHDNTPVQTKTTIKDNYNTTQPTMNPSDKSFAKSTVDSKENIRNNNNDKTLPETGNTDANHEAEAGAIVSLFAGLLALVGFCRKKENN
jgi:hypothetical protein